MLKKPKLRSSSDDAVCNLSHRDLTTEACERALGGFRAARRLDLSRNQLTALPHKTLESHLVELHVGFNCLRDIQAVAGLAHLQVLDLSYNKLDHVDVLVYCSALQTLKLQGNRLTNSRGVDGLKQLHDLDLSDNIIEAPDAIRGLSLNVALRTLALEGNPVATLRDYRVFVLDLLPSVAMLDGKRQSCQQLTRGVSKERTTYAHLYDSKKTFKCMQPSSRGAPTTLTRSVAPPRLLPRPCLIPIPTDEDENDDLQHEMAKPRAYVAARIPPQQQTHAALKSAHASKLKATLQKPTTTESTTYVSLFDRLAVANGVPDREARRPPSSPKAKRLEKPVARAKRKNVISPAKDKLHTPAPVVLARRQLHFEPTPRRQEAPPEALYPSQMRVLDVIQGLIAHKRQTIAALESSQS